MTVAGDVGSGTGTEPMVKVGTEAPLRRKLNINNKKGERKKMKSFKEMAAELSESPVGKVGRTKDSEAAEHIENSDVAKRFRKIVRELGGKTVARQLLAQMNQKGDKVEVSEGTDIKLKGSYVRKSNMKDRVELVDFGHGKVWFVQNGRKGKVEMKMDKFKASYMNIEDTDLSEGSKGQSPSKFLRDLGFKIKDEAFEKHSFELEFYKDSDTKAAYEELKSAGFLEMYSMTSAGKFIGFEDL